MFSPTTSDLLFSPTKSDLLPYVGFCVDDAMCERPVSDIPADLSRVRFVVWQCGFEPQVVAVWSYLPECTVDDSEAEELAAGLLLERGWFTDETDTTADFVL